MAEAQSNNATGVRKYFYFIKENVSSDWKDLAFHLDFRRSDTDNIAGRNRDDKSCCMDLLEEWLKRNGERATIEVLMEALSEAELRSTVDGLRNKYPELSRCQFSKDHTIAQSTARLDQDTKRFRDAIETYYNATITTFKPAIWNENFTLRLSDIFTNLELISTNPTNSKEPNKRSKLDSLDDLFKSEVTGQSTAPRCILIEGEAGGGKTTFLSKEALDSVSQKSELGRRHHIVLLIRLREVWEGETIEEMVWDQCVSQTTEGVDVQLIRKILQRNEPHVLFLLDGYDELRPEARAVGQAIPKLLSGKMYLKSTVVITSRPSAGVQQYKQPDCQVHIMGFSPQHVEKYVRQYFEIVGTAEIAKELITVVRENPIVTDLLHTPIFLMLVCVLWEDDPEMVSPGTMTDLYSNLLTCLGRKHCKREGVEMPTDGLPADLADALLQIGNLALEALLRGETLLDVSQAEKENLNWKLLVKLGVVSLEVSSSKSNPRKQLNFSHKTMQEFLAGRYVAHALMNQDISGLLQLTPISKALEHKNLLQFTCGCDSRAAKAVMEELSKLSSKEFSDLNVDWLRKRLADIGTIDWSFATYKRFVLLCFDVLNERKEPDVLQAFNNALPVIYIELVSWEIRNSPALELVLKYYLDNMESSHLSYRMIIKIMDSYNVDGRRHLQWLEGVLTSPVPGLQLYLELKYVRFDSHSDQTARLASVLKNVPSLKALNLSNAALTPASLRPLVQRFRHVSLLEELDLSGNSELGDAGMDVLQTGLSSVPHLAVLRLMGLHMTAAGMSRLAPHLRHLAGLRELDLSLNKIGDTGLTSLTTVLPTFIAMQVLNLVWTGITNTGMRTLVPALCKLTGLVKLNISNNDIGGPGLESFATILPHLTAMKVLYLHRTGISDRGISALLKTLPHLVELQELDVSSNDIRDSGIFSLVQTLCQPRKLDLEQNAPGDKTETTAPRYNTTLQRTGAGLGRVAQLISALPALTRLDMSGHRGTPTHLSDTAAMALAEALPRLPALKELDLRRISMDPAGFQAVVQAAEEHPTLKYLR
ncbi:NACHT, LRR and PYD domains-containing protein 12-like [Branchiostoma floridae x Branchiostoma belcheri]